MKSWKVTCCLLLALTSCGSGDEVGKVGGRSVSRAEFEAYLQLQKVPASDPARRAQALDAYLQREAMADAIEAAKVLDRQVLEAEVHEFKKDALLERYFDRYLADKVTDEAVENFYTTHAREFEERRVHVAQVLFRTGHVGSTADKAAVRARAEETLSKLRGGADFAKTAESASDDKVSNGRGGDLGWIKEGGVHPAFSESAFGLAPGELSGLVETPFGYHIIRLIEGPTVVKRPLEAARGDIRYRLREEAKRAESERLMSAMKIERGSLEPATAKTADSSAVDRAATGVAPRNAPAF